MVEDRARVVRRMAEDRPFHRGVRPISAFLIAAGLLLGSALLGAASSASAQEVWITELVALNDSGLLDEDRDPSDWIELQNVGDSAVSLDGWFLTDDPFDLFRWRFPAVTLAPRAFLVVFASGKDRAVAGSELHASFRLEAKGEYLALVRPDGSIADEYAPAFPEQYEDVAYGIAQDVETIPFVSSGAAARYLVPANGNVDATWRDPDFDDSPWASGAMPIGFDTGTGGVVGPGGPVNLARDGLASQSSQLGGFAPEFAIDGDFGNFTHTQAGVNLPATWELELLEEASIQSIVLHNRTSCCGSRLRDITVFVLDAPGGNVVYESELLNPENVLGGGGLSGPDTLTVDLIAELGGPILGQVVRVTRTPDPDRSGSGGEGNGDEPDVLSLGEVEIVGGEPGFGPQIRTNVESSMAGTRTSLYLRTEFDVEPASPFEVLTLGVRYDDGFIAYLNGEEIARRNAPQPPRWDSRATAEHPDFDALIVDEIDVTEHADLLVSGRNVLAVHALNSSVSDDDFFIAPTLSGRSFLQNAPRYFKTPTPGAPNDGAAIVGFAADTKFSVDRGFFDAPFEVAIETATAGATIRYTLDGTAPTESTGTVYSGPIVIDRTTVLRAAAYKPGLEPSNVDTQSYFFLDDVVLQDASATLAAGFPSSWNGTSPDYGMDPDVIGPRDRYGGRYAATIQDDLTAIPTISIVLDLDDLFGPRGIYSNPENRGVAWERPASFEVIYPDGETSYQENCGIRIQGGAFRSHGLTKKKSFRLLFKAIYGATKLRFPLFGPDAVDRFDTITLRANNNDGWQWDGAGDMPLYVRDSFGRETVLEMGGVASHELFAHLYLNGFYWGLYDAVERPDASFSAMYFGGDKDNWDSISNGSASNGNLDAWNTMLSLAQSASTLAGYERLLGNFPDGRDDPSRERYLDPVNFADYMITNLWVGNTDWPNKNYWIGRDRRADAEGRGDTGGFKFYMWDSEWSMGIRSDLNTNRLSVTEGVAAAWPRLKASPEFRVLVGDRLHRHFGPGGVFYADSENPRWDPDHPERNASARRFKRLADEVDRAVVAESARWGDQHSSVPYTRDEHWEPERDSLLSSYFPSRSRVVLDQFRAAGLYPDLEAPTFNRPGGRVPRGFGIVATAPVGDVYLTLDGTDPRLPGGEISPAAERAGGVESVVLLAAPFPVRVHVPTDGSLGLDWIDPDYDDSAWRAGVTGVGLETATGYEDLIGTDVEDLMYEKNSSAYIRVEFEVDDPESLAFLVLRMKYDDGYIAYVNGVEVASRNSPASPEWDSRATTGHSDSIATIFESADIASGISALRPGRNVLAIHGLNTSANGGDFLIVPEIEAAEAGEGMTIDESTLVKARALDGESWSAVAEATFIVDNGLRVTELMYHPPQPLVASPYSVEDFEYIELANTGGRGIDLDGVSLAGGIRFDFSTGAVPRLPPGALVLVVKNIEAFESRYGGGLPVAGEYEGNLSNDGERVEIRGRLDEEMLGFLYDDAWVPETDGEGFSLVRIDPSAEPETWGEAASWRASEVVLGTPGVDDSGGPGDRGWQLIGDANQDASLDLSDAISLLRRLFLGEVLALPCEGETLADGGNRVLFDPNGDGRVDLSDSIHLLAYLFLGGSPPTLGSGCVLIEGCPNTCGF